MQGGPPVVVARKEQTGSGRVELSLTLDPASGVREGPATVEVWANWADGAAPQQALVNVDGTCAPMQRARGAATNGAWLARVSNVGTGCHRSFVSFKDAAGAPGGGRRGEKGTGGSAYNKE